MFKFIQRFLIAWKLTKKPEMLKAIWLEAQIREAQQKTRDIAAARAHAIMKDLMPEDRHADRKKCDLLVNITCAEIMSPEEATQILEESHVDNKPKLSESGREIFYQPAGKDAKGALEVHNDKFDRYSPQ